MRLFWIKWAETFYIGAILMSFLNAINATLTLLSQLPDPNVVYSLQYQELSDRSRIIYLAVLVILLGFSIYRYYEGGLWLILEMSGIRISDNLHPHISWINIGMWLTLAAIGIVSFSMTWLLRPEKEKEEGNDTVQSPATMVEI